MCLIYKIFQIMKLLSTLIFSISVALLIIGFHQIMMHGFANSYWIIMFCTGFFLWFAYLKRNDNPGEKLYEKYKKKTNFGKKK